MENQSSTTETNSPVLETFKEMTGADLLNMNMVEMPYLLESLLRTEGLACLAGSSDGGKSALLRQLAIAIVSGETEFLGFKINAIHKSVIYVSTEDMMQDTAYLLKRQAGAISPDNLKGLRYVFNSNNILKKLARRLEAAPADLIIIDCYADTFSGDLKDSQKIRAYMNEFQTLASKHKCLILFLHHTGKRTEELIPSKNNLLSGQGLEAKMRLVIELRVDPKNPNHRHLCIVKGNYLPAKFKRDSYLLEFDESTFRFTNTGVRVPFEKLVKKSNDDKKKNLFFKAFELASQGKNQDEIAAEIGYSDKSSVSKLLSHGKSQGWDQDTPNISLRQPPVDNKDDSTVSTIAED